MATNIGFPRSPVPRLYPLSPGYSYRASAVAAAEAAQGYPVVPGRYSVVIPSGLVASVVDYSNPNGSRPVNNIPAGTTIEVVSDVGNGWFRISSPINGYVLVSDIANLVRQNNRPQYTVIGAGELTPSGAGERPIMPELTPSGAGERPVMPINQPVMQPIMQPGNQPGNPSNGWRDRDRDRDRRDRDRNRWNRGSFGRPPYFIPQYAPYSLLAPPVIVSQLPAVPGYAGPGMYEVTGNPGLNVRSGPGVQYPSAGVLPTGAIIRVFAQDPNQTGWLQTDQPVPGYVYSAYLRSAQSINVGADTEDLLLAAPALIAPLGFRHRKVDSHKTRRVVACAETAFQPLGLFIPRHVAKHFEIKQIRAAGVCLLSNCIPAEYFSNEGCVGPGPVEFPPVLPGQRIEMRVKNISGSDHTFRAALPGTFIY